AGAGRGGRSSGRWSSVGCCLVRGHGADGGGRRRRDRKVRELVAFIGVGGVAAAAHPGGELVGGIGDRGRPGNGGARAPVLKQRPGRAVIDPPFELVGRLAAAGGGGEGDGGAGGVRGPLLRGCGVEG